MSKQKNWKNWENVACLAELKLQTVEPQKGFLLKISFKIFILWYFSVHEKICLLESIWERKKIQMIHLERNKFLDLAEGQIFDDQRTSIALQMWIATKKFHEGVQKCHFRN